MLGQLAGSKGYQQVATDNSSERNDDVEDIEEVDTERGCCTCSTGWIRLAVLIVIISVAAVLAYTAIKQPIPLEHAPVRIAILNATIWTGDPRNPWVSAMGIDGARVVILGSNDQVAKWADDFEQQSSGEGHLQRINGDGSRLVMPGFHDAHCHPAASQIELNGVALLGATSSSEVIERIRLYASNHTDKAWVYGSGWELTLFPDANPSKLLLDNITAIGNRASLMISADGHSAWVNSRALALANISASTPDPPHGRIERDPLTGEPTGTLRELAIALVQHVMPPWSAGEWQQAARDAITKFNSVGITTLQDAGCNREVLEAYNYLDKKGQLHATVVCAQYASPNKTVADQIAEMVELRAKYSSAHLMIPAAKIFVDGVIESRTAALLEPYVDSGDYRGEPNYSPDFLNELVDGFITAGFQVHCHAIGDRAIRMALDAYEHAGLKAKSGRHHIAHLELLHPDDVHRFRQLGVVANMQPFWAFNDTYMWSMTEPLIGPKRSQWLYNFRSIVNTGAVVVGGSDWSVSSMNPLDAIQVGATRQPLDSSQPSWLPDQTLPVTTLAAMYTTGGAYGAHLEDNSGSLRVNQLANFAVFDRNWFDGDVTDIHHANNLCTYFEGKLVYGAC